MRLLKLLLILFVCAAGPAFAEPYDAGPAFAESFYEARAAYDKRDYATALHLWHRLAELGHAEAQLWLGSMYQNGYGVPQNDAAAVAWYRKAADKGNRAAQSMLELLFITNRTTYQWK